MSVSMWAYEEAKCDGKPCAGDCDLCDRWARDEGGDLISRNELWNEVVSLMHRNKYGINEWVTDMIREAIENAPKKGEINE